MDKDLGYGPQVIMAVVASVADMTKWSSTDDNDHDDDKKKSNIRGESSSVASGAHLW